MRKIFFSVFILTLICFSCRYDKIAETVNDQVTIEEETILLGRLNRDAFNLESNNTWFDSTYQAYEPLTKALDSLKTLSTAIGIKVIMGSWCSDSRRDIPALYRILDEIGYDQTNLSVVATDRTKTLPESELEDLDIEYVPTIILYRNEEELGRIIEMPNRTIEEDLLGMLKT